MTQIAKCPRCSGTGKVAFTIDNGICYKCEGSGFIGGTEDEINAAIKDRNMRSELRNTVKSIAKHLSGNKANTLEDLAILLEGNKKQFTLKCPSVTHLFESAFIDNYNYIFTCLNPSNWTLSNRKKLFGKFSIIEKLNDQMIKVTINEES